MMPRDNQVRKILPDLFRIEFTKMTAVLCRLFGLTHIEIAEDIVSETFLKATEVWSMKGLPENPTAWLYTVAKNKTIDYLKHHSIFEKKIKRSLQKNGPNDEISISNFDAKTISDSQLQMIFAVCHPVNPPEAQICLALQILCGFSVKEIAGALLSNNETIKKRLARGREKLRHIEFIKSDLLPVEIKSRLDNVLMTLYLLFNEGYFSHSKDNLIRKDFCSEAIRLTLTLTENKLTNMPEVNALLALMCFQSSRFDARMDEDAEAILFDEQDRSRWNKELIEKGNYYLIRACSKDVISKYHLEANIAYWHIAVADSSKWEKILRLYNQLILIEYSPITALNRIFAFAKVYGNTIAIKEAEKLKLDNNRYYHSLLGYLYSTVDVARAVHHYQQALSQLKSTTEKKLLLRKIEEIKQRAGR